MSATWQQSQLGMAQHCFQRPSEREGKHTFNYLSAQGGWKLIKMINLCLSLCFPRSRSGDKYWNGGDLFGISGWVRGGRSNKEEAEKGTNKGCLWEPLRLEQKLRAHGEVVQNAEGRRQGGCSCLPAKWPFQHVGAESSSGELRTWNIEGLRDEERCLSTWYNHRPSFRICAC